jgi:hypothetical protein
VGQHTPRGPTSTGRRKVPAIGAFHLSSRKIYAEMTEIVGTAWRPDLVQPSVRARQILARCERTSSDLTIDWFAVVEL